MTKSSKWTSAGGALFFIFAAAVVFHVLWTPGAILQASDGNIGAVAYNQRMIEASPGAPWLGETLWGLPDISGLHLWALEN